MTMNGPNLLGDRDLPLVEIIDLAFDYRGNVTIFKKDGGTVDAYVSNRDAKALQPYLEFFDLEGAGPFPILYGDIHTITFTGKDMANGASWEAWQARKATSRQ